MALHQKNPDQNDPDLLARADRVNGRTVAGFTLIELLIVISLAAVLLGLLLPALTSTRELARTTVCAARITQPGMMLRAYASDHRDHFPRIQDASYGFNNPSFNPTQRLEKTWVDLIEATGYLPADLSTAGVPPTLSCPSAHDYENDPTWAGHMPHFGVNMHLSPPKRLEVSTGRRSFFGRPFSFNGNASEKIMMAESRHPTAQRGWFGVGDVHWVAMRHDRGTATNTLYLDGHVALKRDTATLGAESGEGPFAGISFWRQPDQISPSATTPGWP